MHYVVFALFPEHVGVDARLYFELVLGSYQVRRAGKTPWPHPKSHQDPLERGDLVCFVRGYPQTLGQGLENLALISSVVGQRCGTR